MSPLSLVLLLAAVAVGAFAQRTTGIGFTLLAGPACALALEPDHALGTLVRLAIVSDLLVLLADRSGLDVRELRRFLWPAALAFPLALLAANALPATALVAGAAIATIVAALALQRSTSLARRHPATAGAGPVVPVVPVVHPSTTNVAGFAAGFFGVTTGMAGPPLALHASVSGRPLAASRATMTMFFLAVDLVALAAHPTAARPGVTLPLLGAVVAGAAIGAPAARRLPEAQLRRAIPPLVLAGACTALVRVVG